MMSIIISKILIQQVNAQRSDDSTFLENLEGEKDTEILKKNNKVIKNFSTIDS